MTQRFGPWDDALNREVLNSIKKVVADHRKQDPDSEYFYAQDAIDQVGELFDELEAPGWEEGTT